MFRPTTTSATGSDSGPHVLAQRCEGHLTKTFQEERLCGIEGLAKCRVDRLLDQTPGRFPPIPESEQWW